MRLSKLVFVVVFAMTVSLASKFSQAEIHVPQGYKAEVFVSGLEVPKGLKMNSNNELFVIESGKYRILRITPDGSVNVFAVSGSGAPLDFHSWYIGTYPTKMDFDVNGNLYVGAVGGYYNPYNPYGDLLDTIFRITPDGTVYTVARQLFYPNVFYDIAGLTVGPDGYLYIGDTWSPSDILKVDLNTNTSTKFATNIYNTLDLLFDNQNNLLAVTAVSWGGWTEIWSFAPNGNRSLFSDAFAYPTAITWGPEGYLYVLDSGTNSIYTLDSVTKAVTTFATGFYYPEDIEFDSQGNLYVVEPCLGDLTSRTNPIPPCYGHIVKISKSNQPPIANAGTPQVIEKTSCDGAQVTLDGSQSSDPDGDAITYKWSWPNGTAEGVSPTITLPPGITTATLVVNDGTVDSAPSTVDITIQDTIAPTLNVSVSPDTLWSPNHEYVEITPTLTANDSCIETIITQLISIASNEPDNGTGDGDTENDIFVDVEEKIFLRAERSGAGNGRIYTLSYSAIDASGNSTTASAQVVVPHNQ